MQVFDLIGPVMIGPSSSHTAGACRLGRIARKILADRPVKARIGLCGSFAQTYRGHGTDKAIIAGILDMHTYDARLRHALEIASEEGLAYEFYLTSLPGAHPNTAILELTGAQGGTCRMVGASIGGAQVSPKHAGFIVNTGGATAADVLALIAHVQREVLRASGVRLETEVRIIGE